MPNPAIRRHRTYAQGGGTGQTPAEAYAEIVIGLNPVAYWKLDDASGTTAVNYGSLASADATYSASDIAGQTTGPFGGLAPLFVPADSNIVDVYTAALNGVFTTDDSTIAIWYRLDADWSVADNRYIGQLRFDTNDRLLIFKNGANTLRIQHIANGNNSSLSINVNAIGLDDADWHLLLIHLNSTGNVLTIYIDNVSRATGACSARASSGLSSSFSVLAGDDISPASLWDGSLSHVSYFQSLLDSTARTALYNDGPL